MPLIELYANPLTELDHAIRCEAWLSLDAQCGRTAFWLALYEWHIQDQDGITVLEASDEIALCQGCLDSFQATFFKSDLVTLIGAVRV